MKKIVYMVIMLFLLIGLSLRVVSAEDKADVTAMQEEIRQLKERINQLEAQQKSPTAIAPNSNFSRGQWDPFEEMGRMQEEMDRMFQSSLFRGGANAGIFNNTMSYDPQFNIKENPDDYIVEIDTTGFDKDKLDIDIHDRSITISESTKAQNQESTQQGEFHSVSYGSFLKTIPLPENADTAQIKTTKEDTKIIINIPKKKV